MKYLIDFKDDIDTEQIEQWLMSHGISTYSLLNHLNVYIVETTTAPVMDAIVESITADMDVSSQLLNAVEIIPASTATESTFVHDDDWWKTASSNIIDFDAAESTFVRRGQKTTTYILDSGVNATHPEFANATIHQLFSFNGNHDDNVGHGTAIASVIVGSTLGITDSTVKSVKIFDPSTTTMLSDLVNALDATLADILANTAISVVNLSWAIPKNPYIESKIQALINAGAFVVAAAGNNGVPIEDVTPASMDSVFTIGAYDENFVPADFSNYTSALQNTDAATNHGALDAWAPGVNIRCAVLNDLTALVSGTSIAAAITTACLAYNSDLLYSNTGYAQADVYLKAFTLFKKDILDLSDVKYAGSANVIVSFNIEPLIGLETGKYSMIRIAYDNQFMHGYLAANTCTTKVELDGELPAGLSLSNGWIIGQLTTAPVDTETLSYVVTVTFTNGATNQFPLTLYLAMAGTPPGEEPADVELLTCNLSTCGTCPTTCWECGKNVDCHCVSNNPC